jgi:seryl-tRNA synthetase
MIDINLIRENPDLVRENIKKKFQNDKLVLVDNVIALDEKWRKLKYDEDTLRSERNKISKEVGELMKKGYATEAEKLKLKAKKIPEEIEKILEKRKELEDEIKLLMMKIPQIIDKSVPLGHNDKKNVELERIGEPKKINYEIFNHAELAEKLGGVDFDSSRRTSGHGFYYLQGDLALLHSALLTYARDFMVKKGYNYHIPPFMIRSDVVKGVMSFEEMNNMMYKVEGEDLYLIGTSEHSMIGMFVDQILNGKNFPYKLTSYSPCFRKEVGAHGLEEKGLYRVHQFEKQEMVIICEPEDSMKFYEEMLNINVEFFHSLGLPIRKLECCSGDLADLKVKSCDIEAWSPRQGKYFEVGSCSNLGDAQARRLGIIVEHKGKRYYPHTLNDTVVASPRALVAIMENHQNKDGSINIPKVIQPYMVGKKKIEVKNEKKN